MNVDVLPPGLRSQPAVFSLQSFKALWVDRSPASARAAGLLRAAAICIRGRMWL